MRLVLTQESWVAMEKKNTTNLPPKPHHGIFFYWFGIQAFAIKMHKMYPQN